MVKLCLNYIIYSMDMKEIPLTSHLIQYKINYQSNNKQEKSN